MLRIPQADFVKAEQREKTLAQQLEQAQQPEK